MVKLLETLLYPGMTFLDVGAHIGEFTLVAADMVGNSGKAVAIEPLPPCVDAIRYNASINKMSQVVVYNAALCDYTGKIGFQADPERSAGWIAAEPKQVAFEVQCWTFDDFLPFAGIHRVDVVKLDASGNELGVLRGAVKALADGRVGVLVMKLYHPNVTRERFNYASNESIAFLRENGFQLKLVGQENAFPIVRSEDINPHFDALTYCHLLVATKC